MIRGFPVARNSLRGRWIGKNVLALIGGMRLLGPLWSSIGWLECLGIVGLVRVLSHYMSRCRYHPITMYPENWFWHDGIGIRSFERRGDGSVRICSSDSAPALPTCCAVVSLAGMSARRGCGRGARCRPSC